MYVCMYVCIVPVLRMGIYVTPNLVNAVQMSAEAKKYYSWEVIYGKNKSYVSANA